MVPLRDVLAAASVITGGLFTLIAAVGLVRMRDTFSRLQVSTKAATLGAAGALLGSLLTHGWGWKEVLVILFLFLTTPAGAHMLARALYDEETKAGRDEGQGR